MGAAPPSSAPGAPLVSIVTVVLNGAAHVEQAIASVLGQTYRNVEYIVLDGGSTDGTLEILREYSDRVDYWASEPDGGIYAAMNKGIRLARGELVALLNADDFYAADAVERVVERWSDERGPAIYYGDNLVLHDDLNLEYRRHASLHCWLGMSICHQAMFVHREIYRRLGGYREEYRFAADYDFLLRANAAGVEFVHVPAYVVTYRETGLTSRHYRASLAEARRINADHFGRLSRPHAAYLARYYKTTALHGLQGALLRLFGRRVSDALRRIYMRQLLLRSADLGGRTDDHSNTRRVHGSDRA